MSMTSLPLPLDHGALWFKYPENIFVPVETLAIPSAMASSTLIGGRVSRHFDLRDLGIEVIQLL